MTVFVSTRDDRVLDAGLAGERTHLAWIRTGLGVLVSGGAAIKVMLFEPKIGELAGCVIVGLGAVTWTAGYLRYLFGRVVTDQARAGSVRRIVRLVATGIALAAIGALVLGAFAEGR